MAVVGEAYVVIRAVTSGISRDIKNGFDGISDSVVRRAGQRVGSSFSDGFNRSPTANVFTRISEGLSSMVPEAEQSRLAFRRLVRVGFVVNAVLGVLVGGIGALIASLGTLVAAISAAIPSIVVLGNVLINLRLATSIARFALKGVGEAVQQAANATNNYGESARKAAEQLQQLRFEGEAAALSQERAAIALERAKERLERSQDLPVNSRERREAELAFREADLAYRRAKDRNQDVKDELERGPGSSGNDPYANLTESQKVFAKFLVEEILPVIKELRETTAAGFLPGLETEIRRIKNTYAPVLKRTLGDVGTALADAFKIFTDEAVSADSVSRIEQILKDLQPTIKLLGELFANLLDVFLSLFVGSNEAGQSFIQSLIDKTNEWKISLDELGLTGLQDFFAKSGGIASSWGTILGNVFDGIGRLIALNFADENGAGYQLLKWFEDASAGFANLGKDDPEGFEQFFKDALANTRSIFAAIGILLKEVIGLADDPNIKTTFDTLAKAVPDLVEILRKGLETGPAFAELLVSATALINTLTDSEAAKNFFITLKETIEPLNDFLKGETASTILEVTGRIFAIATALSLVFGAGRFLFQAFVGNFIVLFKGFGKVSVGLKAFGATAGPIFLNLQKGAKIFGRTLFNAFFNPKAKFGDLLKGFGRAFKTSFGIGAKLAGVIGLIVGLVIKIVEFYNKFGDFKTMVDNTLAGIGESLGGLWDSLKGLFDNLFGNQGAGGIMAAFDPILKFLLEFFIPGIGFAISTIIDTLSIAINFISSVIGSLFDSFGLVIDGILDLFKGNFKNGLVKIFGGIVIILVGIIQGVINTVLSVINFFISAVENLIQGIGNTPLGDFVAKTFGLDLTTVKLEKIALVDATGAAKNNLLRFLAEGQSTTGSALSGSASGVPRLAKGGIVFPTPGGTLATIAEAGRPERVEPLDPSGLSKRDRAIIKELSPGNGMTVNVYPSAGMNERELAEVVSRRIASEIRRGNV